MITYGVILLVIGVIVWAVGRGIPNRIALIVGEALSAVGLILLIVGLVLLLIHDGVPSVQAMGVLA
jgi:hypothetical protein